MATQAIQDKGMISISVEEYTDMQNYMERLQETVDFLKNKKEVKKVSEALARIKSGKFLTKEELLK